MLKNIFKNTCIKWKPGEEGRAIEQVSMFTLYHVIRLKFYGFLIYPIKKIKIIIASTFRVNLSGFFLIMHTSPCILKIHLSKIIIVAIKGTARFVLKCTFVFSTSETHSREDDTPEANDICVNHKQNIRLSPLTH